MDITKVSQIPTPKEVAKHKEEHTFDEEKSFDYTQITNEIFLGTNMCCLMGYKIELLEKGISSDISLEGERIDTPYGVEHFLWLPVEDTHAPTQRQLEIGVLTLAYCVAHKIKVYVHCKHGHGRAPTLVAAYFISQGMTAQQAIDEITKHRPAVHPTDEQLAALQEYAKSTPHREFL